MFFLDNEIDGTTLSMMNSIEKISSVIPKLKHQLVFLNEREKLFKIDTINSAECVDSPPKTTTNSADAWSSNESVSNDGPASDQSLNDGKQTNRFPEKYVVPLLPQSLIKDIESGAINKFGPHFSNRQILIDTIVHNLIDDYKLL